jgi:signal transduction histidine kinase
LGCSSLSAFGSPTTQQSILVLSAENYTDPYVFKLFTEFRTSFEHGPQGAIAIHPEVLELTRLSSQAYREHLGNLLQEKYRNTDIKAIVTIGRSTLQYLLESRPRLWPDTPIVFAAVSSNVQSMMQLPPNITGHTIGFPLADMVRLSKSLLPETKRIALIGNAPENDHFRPYFTSDLVPLNEQVEFIDLRGKPMEQVRQSASSLPEDTVIYYTGLSVDGDGRKFSADAALKNIMQVANRPSLVDNEVYVDSGALGGMVFDPAVQGREAAKLVQRLLQGESIAAMPIANDIPRLSFDWRELKRWHIDRSQLPPQSEVRFYEPSVWEQYRWQIIGLVAALTLQLILMAALLIERRRRSRAERESHKRLTEIAHMNRTSTATFFSAVIAHELNQPLAAILSNAEAAELFLKMDPPALNEVQDILADICRDNRRASDLIQRMRGLLKKSDSVEQVIDLNDVVKHTLKFLAGEAKTRNIALTALLSRQQLPVFADSVQLQQVIINLVINSMDAMADMANTNHMASIRTAIVDSSAEVCVSDNGPGFGDHVGRIFESFFTTKSQGMGVGLSIASEIIHAHEGQIRAENGAGGGAVVRFSLPLHTDTQS